MGESYHREIEFVFTAYYCPYRILVAAFSALADRTAVTCSMVSSTICTSPISCALSFPSRSFSRSRDRQHSPSRRVEVEPLQRHSPFLGNLNLVGGEDHVYITYRFKITNLKSIYTLQRTEISTIISMPNSIKPQVWHFVSKIPYHLVLVQCRRAFPLESGAVDCFCGLWEKEFRRNDCLQLLRGAAAAVTNILCLRNVGCEISANHCLVLTVVFKCGAARRSVDPKCVFFSPNFNLGVGHLQVQ